MVPLRFCLCSVRFEFLRLAKHTGLIRDDVWALIPFDVKNVNGRGEVIEMESKNDSSITVATPIKVPVEIPGQRSKISAMAGKVLKGIRANPLDSFFPFDPCLLRMLYQSVEASYRCPLNSIPLLHACLMYIYIFHLFSSM